jgi:hypothetical protein
MAVSRNWSMRARAGFFSGIRKLARDIAKSENGFVGFHESHDKPIQRSEFSRIQLRMALNSGEFSYGM